MGSNEHFSVKGECIIHCTNDDSEPIRPKDYSSWKTLLNAAKIRKYKPLTDVSENATGNEVPLVVYCHRKCRSIFTMKKSLMAISNIPVSKNEDHDIRKSTRPVPSPSRVYEQICIFCKKSSKYLKGQKTRESLVKCSEMRSDERIRQAALNHEDADILAIVTRELVAAEAHYHRSCYRLYTKPERNETKSTSDSNDPTYVYTQTEAKAFHDVASYIRSDIFLNPRVIRLTEITSKFNDFMTGYGIAQVRLSSKKNLLRRLKQEFQDSLISLSDEKGRVILIPSNLTMEELILENQKLMSQMEILQSDSESITKVIDKSSIHLRSEIRNQESSQPWPFHPKNLETTAVQIPQLLRRFLVGLLTNVPDMKPTTDRINLLVESFAQDMVYAVTCGRQKTPKHILLPSLVKTLSGNVELIQTLNRLGHGMSYSQLEENETGLCLQKLLTIGDNEFVLYEVRPHVFTTLAWDNIDRLEETLSGAGTSHRVNGIAVQARVFGPDIPKIRQSLVEKCGQRSLNGTVSVDIAPYNAGQRKGPGIIYTDERDKNNSSEMAFKQNMLWILARLSCAEDQIVPGWTGFNILTRDNTIVVQDRVTYLPTINGPATQMSTVFEILAQSSQMKKALQLDSIVVVFDQALYAKASEIVWKHTDLFKDIILRLGTFHTICNFMSVLGKRFKDAGLKDLCIESGILAEGSASGVMEGRHYNRAVRVHKIIYEVLMRMAWKQFQLWTEKQTSEIKEVVDSGLEVIDDFRNNLSEDGIQLMLHTGRFTAFVEVIETFFQFLRNDNGALSKFWMSYIDMVESVLLALIRSTREGNWQLHLSAIRKMIPWTFAYDNLNYARYLPVYYAQMTNLQVEHPDVFQEFERGNFAVQIGSENTFGKIPVDQTTEETVNRDTKTPGGTTRYNLRQSAVNRYYLTAEYRSAFLRLAREMVCFHKTEAIHADLQKTRMAKDESDVKSVVDLLENWIDPFSGEERLVSLSTATEATQDISEDLLKANAVGEDAYRKFQKERLESTSSKFHDTMKKQKLKTFSDINSTQVRKQAGQTLILKTDRNLFGQMIILAQSRKIPLKTVLSHPLGPLPWSLSTPEGQIRKTNKSTLAKELQKLVNPVESIPKPSATIIDGMSLVQKVKGDQKTFGDIAEAILSMALREGFESDRIDIVFDVYIENSIKAAERHKRGDVGIQYHSISKDQHVTQWKKFISSTPNKSSLIEFLVKQWSSSDADQLKHKYIYVTSGKVCTKLAQGVQSEVPELLSSQEEADTRLILHAHHAATKGYESIKICAEDTDVFVLCLSYSKDIPASLYMKSGDKSRNRYVDVRTIASALGEQVTDAIIGLHAFTGCDTVSAFAGKGKVKALKILRQDSSVQEAFSNLGTSWSLTSELQKGMQRFTCLLYDSSDRTSDVNEMRYLLFSSKGWEMDSYQLPPCEDTLQKHCLRANYQAAVWRRCLKQNPAIPEPTHHGWTIQEDTDGLHIEWMSGPPAPQAVLELLSCKCSRSCKLPSCSCMANNLKCSQVCKLKTCNNQAVEEQSQDTFSVYGEDLGCDMVEE